MERRQYELIFGGLHLDRSFYLTEEEERDWSEELWMYSDHADLLLRGMASANCYEEPLLRNVFWNFRDQENFLWRVDTGFVLLETDGEDYKEHVKYDLLTPTTMEHLRERLTKPLAMKGKFTLGYGLLPITEKMLISSEKEVN